MKEETKLALESFTRGDFAHGHMIMCPHCFTLIHPDKGTMVEKGDDYEYKWDLFLNNLTCTSCDKSLLPENECGCGYYSKTWPILLDEAIAYEISVLNAEGYTTLACCAGHYEDDIRSYVYFDKKYQDIIDVVNENVKLSKYLKLGITLGDDDGADPNEVTGDLRLTIRFKLHAVNRSYRRDYFSHVILFKSLLKTLAIGLLKKKGVSPNIYFKGERCIQP